MHVTRLWMRSAVPRPEPPDCCAWLVGVETWRVCSLEVLGSHAFLCFASLETSIVHLAANFSVGFEDIASSY